MKIDEINKQLDTSNQKLKLWYKLNSIYLNHQFLLKPMLLSLPYSKFTDHALIRLHFHPPLNSPSPESFLDMHSTYPFISSRQVTSALAIAFDLPFPLNYFKASSSSSVGLRIQRARLSSTSSNRLTAPPQPPKYQESRKRLSEAFRGEREYSDSITPLLRDWWIGTKIAAAGRLENGYILSRLMFASR